MEKTAFVFPGQGSQAVGMLAELAAQYPEVQATFAEASEVLGYDLWALTQEGPAETLSETDKTQPALLAASVAIFRVLTAQGVAMPSVMAGHSLGEYSALVCAGVIDFKAAIQLVELRGQLMQQAVPAGTGAMYAVLGLDNDTVAELCAQGAEDQVVSPVNFNSPGQVVIAGNKEAVERTAALCKEAKAKMVVALPVSVPSHCELMKPAADKLAQALAAIEFNAPSIAVINNVDVAVATDAAQIKEALIRQLYSPVRWTETVEKMAADGIEQLVEIGPGKVLAGLAKRINRSLAAKGANEPAAIEALMS